MNPRQMLFLPRFLRLRYAGPYLAMNRNRFNREVRPHVLEIPIGERGVAFDRLGRGRHEDQRKHHGHCDANVHRKRLAFPAALRQVPARRNTIVVR